MKESLRTVIRFVLLLITMAALFSFAMFQGGFVSWFLFYSFLPIFLYYISLFMYPIPMWKVQPRLSQARVYAGDRVTLQVQIKRKIPFPIYFCICELIVPETMHKRDLRHKKYDHFHDPSLMLYQRRAKQIIFPWFRRQINLSFDFPHVPRGEHMFQYFRVRTGDFFGFMTKEHTFQFEDELLVYPTERSTHLVQHLTSFEGGSISSYIFQLKNTNVAAGVRDYVAGDKFSWIDWKQTARQQQLMTKEFEQEKSAEMMLIFDGTYHDRMNPIAFEGAVELTLALFEEIMKQSGQVNLLSLGNDVVFFPGRHFVRNQEQIRQHFARMQPNSEKTLSTIVAEEWIDHERRYAFLFITTVFNNEVKRSLNLLMPHTSKVIVLLIQAEQFMTENERKNMQLAQSRGIEIRHITETQLKFDPIEVTL